WPLNMFVTPELKPFFGGTYFPRHEAFGRLGLMELLPRVHDAWNAHRAELTASGDRVITALAGLAAPDTGSVNRRRLFDAAFAYYSAAYDSAQGGFGSAPKFPTPANLSLLLRLALRDPRHGARMIAMVEGQLDAMRRGGIHDHVGGGFHRYSTDARWLVPHFEKMLYDQAQIATAYLDAYQVTGRAQYASTARDVLGYVDHDLSDAAGGFDAAEDADSEGEEGRFYLWTPAEIEAALPGDQAALFEYAYGVAAAGNVEGGRTVLSEVHAPGEVASRFRLTPQETARRLEQARAMLFAERSHRPRPRRDDKVVTAWNGLMISAFARGARVLDRPAYAARAARAAEFVWTHLRDPSTGALRRRWRDGEAAGAGQLADYADYALGLVDLYEATLDPRWLARAAQVVDAAIPRFLDAKDGGLFESPADDPAVAVRLKEEFDGAEVAGSSVAAYDLVLLGRLLDRGPWLARAGTLLDQYARRLATGPAAMPWMLMAMDLEQSVPRHVVVAGDPGRPCTRSMIRAFDGRFLPHDLVLLAAPGGDALARLAPFAAPLRPIGGHATAYVCVNYACRLPTTDERVFARALDEGRAPPAAPAAR
ncbi:MAG: thioredoxin domain-containing protein, partial [Candidatus Eisenbacteria bacterium]|nr:thioredoxin domain-containing protein [Candidatus Eisenbacteria bacterium]